MNQLISISQNNYYIKTKDKDGADKFKKYIELVFLVDKPNFIYSNEGEVVRERLLERLAVTLDEKHLDVLILKLLEVQKAKEEDLK